MLIVFPTKRSQLVALPFCRTEPGCHLARKLSWQFCLIWFPSQVIPTIEPILLLCPTREANLQAFPTAKCSSSPDHLEAWPKTPGSMATSYGTADPQSKIHIPAQQQSPAYGPVQLANIACGLTHSGSPGSEPTQS